MATETKEKRKGAGGQVQVQWGWLYCITGRYSVFLRIISESTRSA